MRDYFRGLDQSISGFLTPVLKWIFYICVAVFLLTFLLPRGIAGQLIYGLGASPRTTILQGRIYEFVTYAFVHASFMHILFNLFALFFFGGRLEQRWGSAQFTRFILVAGAGSVLTHLLVVTLRVAMGADPAYLQDKIVGISGVVYACLLACAMYYPNDIVYFQFILPIKMKYMVAILGLLTLMSSVPSHAGDSIAHLTHLGGLLMGYLFVKFPAAFDWIPLIRLKQRRSEYPDPRERWRKF